MKTKKKNRTKRTVLTAAERKAKKRAEQDLERLKKKLKFLVSKTKLVWNGKPYSTDSTYDFQIHPELVRFFLNLFSEAQSRQADQATLEAAKALNELVQNEEEDENVNK